jgi:glycylpeptide N-tetradecanoyltransferase
MGFWSGVSKAPPQPPSDVPCKLPNGFEWCTCDPMDELVMADLVELLNRHYVESGDSRCRMVVTPEFLRWTLITGRHIADGHVGIRTVSKDGRRGRLVGFVSGTPVQLRYDDESFTAAIINYLCVHGKLRRKRMMPVLISEITRRGQVNGIVPGIYTSDRMLHEPPVAVARYYHRVLDRNTLLSTGYVSKDVMRQLDSWLPSTTPTLGRLREMRPEDAGWMRRAFKEYSSRFRVAVQYDLLSYLLPRPGIVHTYVDEHREAFVSFYVVPFKLVETGAEISVAHAYYMAVKDSKEVSLLLQDAMILAKQVGCHMFNALNVMDNSPSMLRGLGFAEGSDAHFLMAHFEVAESMPPSNVCCVLP